MTRVRIQSPSTVCSFVTIDTNAWMLSKPGYHAQTNTVLVNITKYQKYYGVKVDLGCHKQSSESAEATHTSILVYVFEYEEDCEGAPTGLCPINGATI